jgi:hypothetical protein
LLHLPASVESNPDSFFRYDVFTLMNAVRAQLAAYIGECTGRQTPPRPYAPREFLLLLL